MLLADQGADVIKVESPGLGDLMRYLGSHRNGITGIYANNNRGKRSVVVNLKELRGVERPARQLVGFATCSSRTSGRAPWTGSASATTTWRPVNPRLVYVSISGFGGDRPVSRTAAAVYDNVIQGYAGYASVPDQPAPPASPPSSAPCSCDKATGATPRPRPSPPPCFARERGIGRGPAHRARHARRRHRLPVARRRAWTAPCREDDTVRAADHRLRTTR